jgi:hypothetical protein
MKEYTNIKQNAGRTRKEAISMSVSWGIKA